MARWDAALNDNRVLTDSSRRKYMTGYVNEGPDGRSQYAYGWAVMKTSRGTRLVTHNGGNGIYVAEFLRFVDEGVTIFVASTVSELTATSAVRVIARIVFGEPYDLPPVRAAASPATLAAAAGAYRLADGSRLTVRAEDGQLTAEAVGQQAYALLLTGDTVSSPAAADRNQRSRAIVDALVGGDVGPLVAALGPGGPEPKEVAEQEAQLMAGRRERFGAFRSVEVLGTVLGAEGGLQTTVRLNFDRGGATNIYTWNRAGRIMDLGARPWQAVELVPVENGEFQALDARGGTALRLGFDAGQPVAITPHGRLRLERP
jgi:hypothetical protein